MKLLLVLATAIAFRKCSCQIPSDIKKCHSGDVVCMTKTVNDLLRKHPGGHKEAGLRNLEPVHLDELVVSRAQPNSPINLNFKFTDLDMYGLSKTNITRMVGFEKDPRKSKFEIYSVVPLLTLRGQYVGNGKVLLLPIVGKGNAEIHLKNFKNGVKAKITTTNENGKMRVAIDKLKVQADPELMTVKLENLFNGNKELGDELNNVINANWRDIWTELESGINEGFSDVVNIVMGDVINKFYYDDIYTD